VSADASLPQEPGDGAPFGGDGGLFGGHR
jgi:hypothetical protein